MAAQVFINYRRALHLEHALLLQSELQHVFGRQSVFVDVSGLDGGDQWIQALDRKVDSSTAMISLIGPGWLDSRDSSGHRRIDDPHDFVRYELARALMRNKPVLPVLIGETRMPEMAELPPNLAQLTLTQALHLRLGSVNDDVARIAASLQKAGLRPLRSGPSPWSLAGGSLIALTLGLMASPPLFNVSGFKHPLDPGIPFELQGNLIDQSTAFAKERDEARSELQKRVDDAVAAAKQFRDVEDQLRRARASAEQAAETAAREREEVQSALRRSQEEARALDIKRIRELADQKRDGDNKLVGLMQEQQASAAASERIISSLRADLETSQRELSSARQDVDRWRRLAQSQPVASPPAVSATPSPPTSFTPPGWCSEQRRFKTDEQVICRTARLAELDSQLRDVYGATRNRLSTERQSNLRSDQAVWLRERESCGSNVSCLVDVYTVRIQQLRSY